MSFRPIQRALSCVMAVSLVVATAAIAQSPGPGVAAQRGVNRDVPRQLQLIVEPARLLASNIRLGRIDEWPLDEGETVLQSVSASAVLAVASSRRLLAYGPVIGWRELELEPGEQVEVMEAEDYALFVTTDRRYLNFSADTGIWAETGR